MLASKYFDRDEFTCRCGCGFDTVDADLLFYLNRIREHFGRAVVINSACRCATHNAAIGGSAKSQHLLGRAADIVVSAVPPGVVADYADEIGVPGVGRYKTFTHIDTRNKKARW